MYYELLSTQNTSRIILYTSYTLFAAIILLYVLWRLFKRKWDRATLFAVKFLQTVFVINRPDGGLKYKKKLVALIILQVVYKDVNGKHIKNKQLAAF